MYALAKFKRKKEYAVFPLGWLYNNNQSCWWPKKTADVKKMIEDQELPEKTWNSFEVLKVVRIIVGNYQEAEKCLEVFLNHPTDQSSNDFDESEITLQEDWQTDGSSTNQLRVEENTSTVPPTTQLGGDASGEDSLTSAEVSESSIGQGSNSDSDSDGSKSDDEIRPLKKRAKFMNTRTPLIKSTSTKTSCSSKRQRSDKPFHAPPSHHNSSPIAKSVHKTGTSSKKTSATEEVSRRIANAGSGDQEDYFDLYDEDRDIDDSHQTEKLGQKITVPETFQQIPERQFQYIVLNKLFHSENTLDQVQQSQGQLLALFNSGIGWLKKPPKVPDLPVKELGVFESMNTALDEDDGEKCMHYLVRKLSTVGERELKPAINKMLKMLMEDVVAKDFNWDGNNEKKAFGKTNFVTVIEEACRKIFPADKASDKSVKSAIQDWLKNAPGRYNYPKKSAKKHSKAPEKSS
ncbi:hypothetical protein QAD02_013931 [Eretmocerus hayati]|uniref:Uncharacterized protein n=1 Tax=Eretmocerus hayati TaxID=131215 RepID=A0ACC2P3H6_9HYME|nr:hypothetical protein QAD02_013931 [Eretmocerus hayati]